MRCRVQVPDRAGPANHTGPESCVALGNGRHEALTGEGAGRVWRPAIGPSWVPTRSEPAEGHPAHPVMARGGQTWRGRRPLACTDTPGAAPGRPCPWPGDQRQVRTGTRRGTTVLDGCQESDRVRGPRTPWNQGRPRGPAEEVEGRALAKGPLVEHHRGRTPCRETLPQARDGVRQVLCTCASSPEAGARCGSAARRDLCGGASGN